MRRPGPAYREVVTLRAVLFDFSGTLFRLEEDDSWLTEITGPDGNPLDVDGRAELLRRMTTPSGEVVRLAEEYQHAWANRDLDPELHRKVYLEVLRSSGVQRRNEAESLYQRLIDPFSWIPYRDTDEVLRNLRAEGVATAVISNIAFDIRPAFDRHGLTELVDEVLMSYTEGVVKPDPKIFLRACERLGVEPGDALMVGDSSEADGAATEVGCKVAIVDPLPTAQRPDALLSAVAAHR